MTAEQIVTTALHAAHNPYLQLAAAAVILQLLPNSVLSKLPVVGPSVQAFVEAWAKRRMQNFNFQQDVIEKEARRIVAAKSQYIKTGKLDAQSAKAQALHELVGMFGIDPAVADKFVEAEVRRLNDFGLELFGSSEAFSTAVHPDQLN